MWRRRYVITVSNNFDGVLHSRIFVPLYLHWNVGGLNFFINRKFWLRIRVDARIVGYDSRKKRITKIRTKIIAQSESNWGRRSKLTLNNFLYLVISVFIFIIVSFISILPTLYWEFSVFLLFLFSFFFIYLLSSSYLSLLCRFILVVNKIPR